MDDINDRLSEILSNPDSMRQIQSLMSSLGTGTAGAAPAQPAGEGAYPATGTGGLPDMSMLSNLLNSMGGSAQQTPPATGTNSDADGAQVMAAISQMAPLMQKMREDDDSTRLLRALRPMLSHEKQTKLDESLKIMQLLRLMPMMKNSGILSGLL